MLRRLTTAAPAAYEFLKRLAERGGAMGPTIVRMEKLLDLFGAEALQEALGVAKTHPTPDVYAVQVILDQRQRQMCLPPPIGVTLPEDSPLRRLSITPHSLSAYDRLPQWDFHCIVCLPFCAGAQTRTAWTGCTFVRDY